MDVDAAGAGPFGTTIAHGFLTLSLLPHFASQVFRLETPGARLNYGLKKVRFPSPVPVDSRLRSHVRFGEVRDLPTGKQLVVEHTIEIEGHDKPACVAAARGPAAGLSQLIRSSTIGPGAYDASPPAVSDTV